MYEYYLCFLFDFTLFTLSLSLSLCLISSCSLSRGTRPGMSPRCPPCLTPVHELTMMYVSLSLSLSLSLSVCLSVSLSLSLWDTGCYSGERAFWRSRLAGGWPSGPFSSFFLFSFFSGACFLAQLTRTLVGCSSL